jgi:hypothetical protein
MKNAFTSVESMYEVHDASCVSHNEDKHSVHHRAQGQPRHALHRGMSLSGLPIASLVVEEVSLLVHHVTCGYKYCSSSSMPHEVREHINEKDFAAPGQAFPKIMRSRPC